MSSELNAGLSDEWVQSHVAADWTGLPVEYAYVIEPCKKYALRICAYGETMPLELSPGEMAELEVCAQTIRECQHNEPLGKWAAGKRKQRQTPEMAMVSTLLEMLDEYRFPLD